MPGVHSSNAIMMSAPIVRWMSTTFSGVKKCFEPSMCERNIAPSSVSLRLSASENTWNPPLSVRIGRSQPLNLCSPPACSKMLSPGRRYRWYVLPSIIWACMSSFTSRMCTPLTDATVPTGMNIGVSIVPWSVVIMPARAEE